jgi:hypothetical protein
MTLAFWPARTWPYWLTGSTTSTYSGSISASFMIGSLKVMAPNSPGLSITSTTTPLSGLRMLRIASTSDARFASSWLSFCVSRTRRSSSVASCSSAAASSRAFVERKFCLNSSSARFAFLVAMSTRASADLVSPCISARDCASSSEARSGPEARVTSSCPRFTVAPRRTCTCSITASTGLRISTTWRASIMQSYSCAAAGMAEIAAAAAKIRRKAKAFIEFGVMDGGNYELSVLDARRVPPPRAASCRFAEWTRGKMPTISHSLVAVKAESLRIK